MTLETLLVFLPACFALNMAFGPNNLLSLTNGARDGAVRATIAASGRLAAFAAMILITALGLGALLATSELVFTVVKWLGAAYLVWIGVKLLRSGAPVVGSEAGGAPLSLKSLMLQEFWVAAGNPKAILIFTAFFPQFIDPANYLTSFAVLGASFLALEVVAMTIYAAIGARLGSVVKGGNAFRWFNRASGSLMIGFGLMLAFVRRPTA
ncbi:LysE family translocator [Azospirillum soli]|uniref:LysE family translocator n=1 Tax=Azospirillum soli TaxID=1304799 RepID=UPI001AE538C3|nr:LysE family translocator [Azospirillum soli]MBP2313545.1 threonine/homoserine/homoserine lactone efflux protein [Azospirillum soli]